MTSALFDAIQTFEIDSAVAIAAWQHSQAFATPASRWNAYLNELCVQTLLPEFQIDDAQARVLPNRSAIDSIWELVNGTAMRLANARVVLIPTEAIDTEEVRVPQEWIDIPNWAADYYFAVQVNPDDGWVRIYGYTTHQQLKSGEYDWRDRTYSLANPDLNSDLSAFWIVRQLYPAEVTRAAVEAVPALPLEQARSLIDRCADSALLTPRTAIPFSAWAGLLQHGGWRQQLSDRRRGLPEARSVWNWLRSGLSEAAQQLGWSAIAFEPNAIGARGTAEAETGLVLSRQMTIANQLHELRVIPLAAEPEQVWRFELQNLTPGRQIAAGTTLRLVSEDLQPFPDNEDQAAGAVDRLYIDVALAAGEGIVWAVEPMPLDYDLEILRF